MSTLYETDRQAWIEQQWRMLLIVLAARVDPLPICVNSKCEAGPVPHMSIDGLDHPVSLGDL